MAKIREPRVRSTTTTEGQAALTLGPPMFGSLGFHEVMAHGDTCDYVINQGDAFEEGTGTWTAGGAYGGLSRDTIRRSHHASGLVNVDRVAFGPGTKTVIMTVRTDKVAADDNALMFDRAQTLTTTQQDQARENLKYFPAGTRMIFQQTTPPTGWTKDTSLTDRALRITSGTVTNGGQFAFSTVFGRTATDNLTLDHGHLPNPTLTGSPNTPNQTLNHVTNGQGSVSVNGGSTPTTVKGPDGSGATHSVFTTAQFFSVDSHTVTFPSVSTSLGGSGTPHSHGIDLRVVYTDVILATKS